MQGELLFEIGLEEMPYDFLSGITTLLSSRFREVMAGRHVPLERVEAFATPRRLLLVAEGMAPRAADRRIEKF
ncbi:MAG: glycine--tRNA ligase subunit beta, partial [Deltaproteobacteria bacterium]